MFVLSEKLRNMPKFIADSSKFWKKIDVNRKEIINNEATSLENLSKTVIKKKPR